MAITSSGVGIGIDRPNPSAALEISSTNQDLLLPRVNDTSAVATPAEGLMIYNKATNTPSYFDGARWSSIQSSTPTLNLQDSITYRITSPNGTLLIAGTAYINSVFLLNARLKGIAGDGKEGLQSDFSLKSLSVVPPRIELGSKV